MNETINPFGKDIIRLETEFCGRKITLETGRLAFQAQGAVMVTCVELSSWAWLGYPILYLEWITFL